MKTPKRILIVGLAFASTFAFAQKKEIKKAERAIKSEKYTEAIAHLKDAEGLLSNADDNLKADFYRAKGDAFLGSASSTNYDRAKEAADAYEQFLKLKPNLRESLDPSIQNLRSIIINSAVRDQNSSAYEKAAEKLIVSYNLGKDPSDLYFAAGNYVNSQKYSNALEAYNKLLDMGYTGETTEHVATDKETGEVVPFADKNTRDIAVKTGEFIKPETRQTPSRRGEILRNITLIYIQEGQTDKAQEVMASARAENPDDVYLMRAEADMSYNMGDIANYNKLMNEIVATDPDNPEIHFNLGVASQELGETDKAIKYYEKAIELKPDYEGALINLAVLKLAKEGPLVEEMNNLGMSAADNKRYDELIKQREDLYTDALPLLEKVLEINPKNVEVIRTIMNIHGQLGNDTKQAQMKAKLNALGAE